MIEYEERALSFEEKEALFIECQKRLNDCKKNKEPICGYETNEDLEPASEYFWSKYYDMSMTGSYDVNIWRNHGIAASDLGLIRQLVCHAYGVYIVGDIPQEKIGEANGLAKQMINLLFNTNQIILEQKQRGES